LSRGQNRGQNRAKLDQYWTPDPLAEKLVELLPIWQDETALEPHAGGGAFVKALRKRASWVGAIDLDPTAPGLELASHSWVADSTTFEWRAGGIWAPPVWVGGNCPYKEAVKHVRAALKLSRRHVFFLIPLSFLESEGRSGFWRGEGACLRGFWALQERVPFLRATQGPGSLGKPLDLFQAAGVAPSKDDGGGNSTPLAFFWWDKEHSGPPEHFVPCWSWKV